MLAALLLLLQSDLPTISGPIDDRLGLLSAAVKRELEAAAADLDQKDSTQVAVLIVGTTAPYEIADYAVRTFNKNKIGQEKTNNGVLIVVAKDDRKCWISVGYGLEGKLTDALCSQIVRNEMVPNFKKGEYGAGIRAGTLAVIAAVRGEYKGKPFSNTPSWTTYVVVAAVLLIFGLHFYSLFRTLRRGGRSGMGWWALGSSSWSSGGSSSGWSGGGSSWSGGGGFSGGGGAGGSW